MSTAKPSQRGRPDVKQLVGLTIDRALISLLEWLPGAATITFVTYQPAPGLSDRLAAHSDPTSDIRQAAERLREEYGIPFWDAVFAIAMNRDAIPVHYVDLAILHDKSPLEQSVDLVRSELTPERLESLMASVPSGSALAVSSRVRLDTGVTAHIPMMDFRCHPSPANAAIAKRALSAMGQSSGVLAASGRSYHFYGLQLLTPEEWVRFMALGVLFTPVVDSRYIAHRLADGACRLRISRGPNKQTIPRIEDNL